MRLRFERYFFRHQARNTALFNILAHDVITYSQPAIACSKLTIETLEQGVKYVQS